MSIINDMYDNSIKEYLSTVNFNSENFSVKKLKEELKQLIGYEPAIKIVWDADKLIGEGSTQKKIEKIKSLRIDYYVGGDLNTPMQFIEILP